MTAALSQDEFHAFVEGLDYPMYVVTASARDDGSAPERSGCLVGFATQASIDPPRMLIGISVANHTHGVAARAELIGVHLLDRSQHDLAALFGGETGEEVDKFSRCAWQPGPDGVPLLDDAPRHVVGRVLARHPLGDHTGYLIEPVGMRADETEAFVALTYADANDLDPGQPA